MYGPDGMYMHESERSKLSLGDSRSEINASIYILTSVSEPEMKLDQDSR